MFESLSPSGDDALLRSIAAISEAIPMAVVLPPLELRFSARELLLLPLMLLLLPESAEALE